MLTTVAVVAGLAIGTTVWLRSQRTRDLAPAPIQTRAPTRLPTRDAPAIQARRNPATRTTLLRLHAPSGCCGDAQLLAEHPLSSGSAPALPLIGCGRMDCACRYERAADARRTERRLADDRRDAIRFENGRRRRPDRRMQNTVWNQAQ